MTRSRATSAGLRPTRAYRFACALGGDYAATNARSSGGLHVGQFGSNRDGDYMAQTDSKVCASYPSGSAGETAQHSRTGHASSHRFGIFARPKPRAMPTLGVRLRSWGSRKVKKKGGRGMGGGTPRRGETPLQCTGGNANANAKRNAKREGVSLNAYKFIDNILGKGYN